MCSNGNLVRRLVLFEGQVKWIMERETPEERLAAWETLVQIAFPDDPDMPYQPPQKSINGKQLSACDRVQRDVYNLFKNIIESQASRPQKDLKKVEAGKLGAATRYGRRDSSSASTDSASVNDEEEQLGNPLHRGPQTLSSATKKNKTSGFTVEEWQAKIPDAEALQKFLIKNYVLGYKTVVVTKEFCEYAYHRIAIEEQWINPIKQKPYGNIFWSIYNIVKPYMKMLNDQKRFDEAESQKDKEFKSQADAQQVRIKQAETERRQRYAAEQAEFERLIREQR